MVLKQRVRVGKIGLVLGSLGLVALLQAVAICSSVWAAVSLSAPADGNTVSGTVTITAQPSASVAWVNVYVDGNYLTSSPPFNFSWNSNNVPNGNHTISIQAYNNSNQGDGYAAVTVQVANGQTTGGSVGISTPSPGSTVSGSVPVNVQVGSNVEWVDVYVDGNYWTSSPPYDFSWDSTSVPDGNHTIAVSAFDSSDAPVGEASTNVSVSNSDPAPSALSQGSSSVVSITAPSSGASVSGSVSIDVSAASNVEWVDVYVDGNYLASSPPFSFNWDTSGATNGQHTISVTAFNSSSQVMAQSSIPVTVSSVSGTTGSGTTSTAQSSGSGASSDGLSYLATLGTLPPGASLPSGSQCANMISYSSWEPRPGNASYNQTTPPGWWLQNYDAIVASGEGGAPGSYLQRVTGNFTGTTDEILQWGACKWGFDANVVRAIAVNETHWHQSGDGDGGISLGILQIKDTTNNYPSTVPYAAQSTAFNVDYKLAQQRACFDGQMSYLDSGSYPQTGRTNYMLWGCVGQWYSGGWYDSGAQSYISQVQQILNDQTWAQPGF
jgi:hypothetical protein